MDAMDASNLPAIGAGVVGLAFLGYVLFRLGPVFLARRLVGLLAVMFGVSFITFILGYFAPGDTVVEQLGKAYAVKSERDTIRHFYGLDLPWYEQYGKYLNRLLRFDLGYSWSDRTLKVWNILRIFVPTSMALGLASLAFAVLLGVPLGMLAAVRSNSHYDTLIQVVALTLYAGPTYVIIPFYQLAMVWLYNNNLPHLGIAGWGTWDTEIAPIVITGLASFAFYVRFTPSSVVEVMRQDYVRTARAKGLSERIVLWRHVLRNAMLPLVTILGPAIGFVVTGLFITEQLFNIPGIGVVSLKAIGERDYSVVQGVVILLAASVALMNVAADIAYGLVDPRIRTART